MLDRVALAVEAAWYRPPRWMLVLLPLEVVFIAVTALRRRLFQQGVLASRHPGVPVVIVGNISVGGTGKTPVVIALANELQRHGLRVGVVSRGYGRAAKGITRVSPDSQSGEVGDEALLIARNTQAIVVVGRDRCAAAERAVQEGCEVILSDDGLQHYALRRDIEVVTMDAQLGFGNGHRLPVGPLREPPRRLATVDFLLQRNGHDPHMATRYQPSYFWSGEPSQRCAVDERGFGPQVHAVAAIARPQRFFETLHSLGLEVVEHPLPDHAPIPVALLQELSDRPVIISSKDAVKVDTQNYPNLWVLEMSLAFPAGFIDRLTEKLMRLRENAP